MGGLTRFERRWSWWTRMRDRMHWQAYDSAQAQRQRTWAMYGVIGGLGLLLASMVLVLLLALTSEVAHAQTDRIPPEAARYQLQLKREAQRVWGLNAPVASFAAQIHQESRWNPEAQSQVGAQGLAQFMPSTAAWISGIYPSLADRAPTNPAWAIRALVTYDAHLFTQIRQADDDCQRFAFALSAYNGGLGWVNKRQALSPNPGQCFDATCDINPGVTPASQRENAHYPRVILQRFQALYRPWGLGICP